MPMTKNEHLDLLSQEYMRGKKRAVQNRLTFDCFNCICQEGTLVVCKAGIKIGEQQGLTIIDVLTGKTAQACKRCKFFDNNPNIEGGKIE